MIEIRQGNLLEADAEALVNTVNCVGIMGRGIALQFRQAFPGNYKAYKAACERGEVRIGRMFVTDLNRLQNPRVLINFPTKRHWKARSRFEDIEAGLPDLVETLRRHNVRSVAVPPLGCGLGGLEWRKVRPLIEKALNSLEGVQVLLYEPSGAPEPEQVAHRDKRPAMTPGRAAMLTLMGRYLGALMDTGITLLEIHKLMYFLQEAGQPLRLRFKPALYGPYAENLRHVLIEIDGHFITGYGEGRDNPDRVIEIREGALGEAADLLGSGADVHDHCDRVGDLIQGFETPFGMELLSTVHWVAIHGGAANLDDAIRQVYAWNERKRMFTPEHIAAAWAALERDGWLSTNRGARASNGIHRETERVPQ